MKHGLKGLCGAGALVLPLSVWLPAMAQQPVVEDLTGQRSSFYQQAETREEAGGSLVIFNQVQQHDEEIRQLRGQVEELRHQLDQLRRQSREQYLDLEERLASGSAGMEMDASTQVDDEAAREVVRAPSPSGASADAQAAYQAAFARVQSREFGEAINAFNRFVVDHPGNTLTANAWYWLGELHSAEGSLDEAEGAFHTVLDDFPQSSKVPDALYKLGLLKARQGEPAESRELLERLLEEYPETSAAGLANDFLRQSGS
ncbi:tol-pal system protein YbgF [Halomonas sp. C05BenzN]|uniref:tol-pal system protein YbgF n=1 Tax=Halomonas sp. C05BenzN TaxID=3411041 RepID=UPI003B94B146